LDRVTCKGSQFQEGDRGEVKMCKAFSCIVHKDGRVFWKAGLDSHDAIMDEFKLRGLDRTADPQEIVLARVEITPDKGYLFPEDSWTLKIDEEIRPIWWVNHHEIKTREELAKWKDVIYSGINLEEARNPIDPRKITKHKVTEKDIANLKKWASVGALVWDSVRASVGASVWASVGASVRASVGASVGDSVGDSVGASVWASVRDSVRASVGASVGASVRDSVGASVWASVRAYTGSIFTKIDKWQYNKHASGVYPFQPVVDLWKRGFVPSFDGKTWRLHQGKDMKVVYERKK
jgi:hypothetical protein